MSKIKEDYEDLLGSRPFAIRHCLLDTLRSQIECDEMSLHGHLFTIFLVSHTRHELMYAIASMSEIWGMGIYDVIVLACWKMPPHI